ncbi:MAG: spore coat associated protein CotJA [Lachnospira sp.]|nr:spore coat associated protein CotJA [Lachnospira sp.]
MDYMNKKRPQQVVGMAYVPWQNWGELYEPAKALQCGTLFAVLNKPFIGCRCDRKR